MGRRESSSRQGVVDRPTTPTKPEASSFAPAIARVSVASAPSRPLRVASCHRQCILSSLALALAGSECGSRAAVRPRRRCGGRDSIGSSCSLFLLSLVLIEFQTRLGARSPRRPVALLSLFSSSGKKALSSAPLGKRRIVSTRGGRRDAKRGRSSSRAIGERAAAAAACSLLRFAHLDLLSSFPPPPTKKNFLTQAKTSASSSRTASSSRSPPRSTPAPGPAPPPRPRPRAGTRATESAAGEFCFFFFFRGRKKEDMKGSLTTSSSFLLLLLLVLSSNPTE